MVRGYIFRFLSQLSILAPKLGLGEIATVLACAVLGSFGKDSMSGITRVWKRALFGLYSSYIVIVS